MGKEKGKGAELTLMRGVMDCWGEGYGEYIRARA